jgi:hypothetical protein
MQILTITIVIVIEIVKVSVIRAVGSVINDNLIFTLEIGLKIIFIIPLC